MTEEMTFFIYLLEQYAAYRGRKTGDILREWDRKRLTQRIYDNYWGYYTERLENACGHRQSAGNRQICLVKVAPL